MKTKIAFIALAFCSLCGFACPFVAGISLERLNASTDPVSGWTYAYCVALPIFAAACAACARWFIGHWIRGSTCQPGPADTQYKTLTAIAAHVDELAARGSTKKARELLDAIDIVTGAPKS